MIAPLKVRPVFKERVWGGNRLRPGCAEPIGEAWIVFEGCTVDGGAWDGHDLEEVARQCGEDFLGAPVVAQTGARFPLLIKLLHSTEWLSVQVHPDDEQARSLEGPDEFGKTEAWHVLDADEDACVVYGLNEGWTKDDLRHRAERGTLEAALNFQPVLAGETLFTPAGCVHAIGPGLFIYEVQQTSDITYRLYDWNRPASAGRSLHLDKAMSVIGDCQGGLPDQRIAIADCAEVLAGCEYFVLERLSETEGTLRIDTGLRSFHCLTVTSGAVRLTAAGSELVLRELETVVIPAVSGEYQVEALKPFEGLVSRVP